MAVDESYKFEGKTLIFKILAIKINHLR